MAMPTNKRHVIISRVSRDLNGEKEFYTYDTPFPPPTHATVHKLIGTRQHRASIIIRSELFHHSATSSSIKSSREYLGKRGAASLTVLKPIMDYLQEPFYPAPPSSDPSYAENSNSDPYNGMPPPSEGEFATLPDVMKHCQEHAGDHGYACVTASNNYKRGIAYVRCDRGGKYVNHWNLTDETRVRKNRTRRLVDCKWKARAKQTEAGTWVLTMMNDKHNGHSASPNASSHPSLRQLPAEAMEEVRQAFKTGLGPKQVWEFVKERWNPSITVQDVYNLKAKISRADQGIVKKGRGRKSQSTEAETPTDPLLLQQPRSQPEPVPEVDSALGATSENRVKAPGENGTGSCPCQCCHH